MAVRLFHAYHRLMERRPLLTHCVTCGVLMGAGDVIAQKLIEKQPRLNVQRTAKFAVFGGLYVGPAISVWFKFLDRPFGVRKVLLKPWQKVAIDQSLFAPSINFFALPLLGVLNGKSWPEIQQNIRENYVDIMIAFYKIWPAAQLVNFYFVPLNYRVVYVSVFSLVWNSYFAWKLGEK